MSENHIHQTRLRRCGSFFSSNGKQNMYYCADFRNCQRCSKKRIELEYRLLENYMAEKGSKALFFISFTDEKKADNFTSRLRKRKELYRRYVTETGISIIHDSDLGFDNFHEVVRLENLVDILPTLVMTREGCCMSGKLGQKDKPKDDRRFVKITATGLWSDAPVLVQSQCLQEALEETLTLELDPQTPEQYEEAWQEHNAIYERKLNEKGYKITSRVRFKKKLYLTQEMNFQAEVLECLGVRVLQTVAGEVNMMVNDPALERLRRNLKK